MRRRIVTALFCDVVGSTARAEHADAEAVLQAMLRYFAEARVAIEGHGGVVEKFIGDAVVGMFGVEVAHDDDALRAVRAAVEIRDRVVAIGPELERVHGAALALRIAVNTGEVAAGVDPVSGRAVVVADAVNVAARLQQSAAPGEIVLGEQTHRLVRRDVLAEALGAVAVRGRGRAAGAYRLRHLLDEPGRLERHAGRPLVGREAELDALLGVFEETVAAGTGRMVTVVGEAGIGKSRLAHELAERVGGAATVMYGASPPYGAGAAHAALAQVVRGLADVDTTAETVRARLEALAGAGPDASAAAIAGPALGLWDGPAVAMEEVVAAVRALLAAAARRRPLLAVLDDLHWADAALLAALPRLAAADAPVLVVGLARPEITEQRPDWPVTLRVGPLGDPDVATLLDGLLGPGLGAIGRRVASAAQGNPLFVEQLVAMLADDGVLGREDAAPPALAIDLALPPSLAVLMTARLDRLPPTARAVAERAAVVGVRFDAGAVVPLCADVAGPEAVADALATLAAREFLAAEGTGYRFRHVLLREAAYAGTSKTLRARLHEAHADWLERHRDGWGTDDEIGHHLERAFRLRAELGPVDAEARGLGARAGVLLGATGRRALGRGEAAAAMRALDRALALVDDTARPAVAYDLAVALVEVGDLDRAQALLGGLAAGGPGVDGSLRALASLELAWVGNMLGSANETELRLRAERAMRAGAQDAGAPGRAHFLLGFLHFGAERQARAVPALEQAMRRARAAGDGRLEADAAYFLACAAFFAPAPPAEAAPFWERLEPETRDRPAMHGAAATGLALQRAIQGRFADARALLAGAETIYEELGMGFHRAATDYCRAEVEMLAGEWAAAATAARAGYDARLAVGDRAFASGGATYLATIAEASGRHEDVAALVDEADALAAPDDVQTQARIAGLRGTVLARAGRHAEALAAVDAAAALLDPDESPLIVAETLGERATVLGLAGRDAEAADALRRAVTLHERKGNVPGARRVRGRLSSCRAGTGGSRRSRPTSPPAGAS